jgi:hypothetical protein
MPNGSVFNEWTQPAKFHYNYKIGHGATNKYFQAGIAPLCIFCCAIGSVLWGTIAGFLIKSIDMTDKADLIQKCIDKYAEQQAKKEAVGGEKQATKESILHILEKVGGKITEVSFLKSIIKHNVFCCLI